MRYCFWLSDCHNDWRFFFKFEGDFLFRCCEFHSVIFPISFPTITRYFLPFQSTCTRRLMKRWIICRTEHAILWNFVWNNQILWWKPGHNWRFKTKRRAVSEWTFSSHSSSDQRYICSFQTTWIRVPPYWEMVELKETNSHPVFNFQLLLATLSNLVASFSDEAVVCAGKGLWTLRSGEKLIADPGRQCN